MIIEKGEKIHIITRRHFNGDLRRHFVGEVLDVERLAVRIEGYAFIYDSTKNDFVRKPRKRIRIFDLSRSGYIVSIIPSQVLLHELTYKLSDQKTLVFTDGKLFQMDISEFGAHR